MKKNIIHVHHNLDTKKRCFLCKMGFEGKDMCEAEIEASIPRVIFNNNIKEL